MQRSFWYSKANWVWQLVEVFQQILFKNGNKTETNSYSLSLSLSLSLSSNKIFQEIFKLVWIILLLLLMAFSNLIIFIKIDRKVWRENVEDVA